MGQQRRTSFEDEEVRDRIHGTVPLDLSEVHARAFAVDGQMRTPLRGLIDQVRPPERVQ